MKTDLSPTPVELAAEPVFRLGPLEVRPATLEVIGPAGREQLEPRIMQVLVALARRRGEIVARDELIQACWGGRIVGDDAINRCVSRLRKLAAAQGGFQIDTTPRVGLRLRELAAEEPWPAGRRRFLRYAVLAALLLALAGVGWWAWRGVSTGAPQTPSLAVIGFKPLTEDPQSRELAQALADDASGFLGERALASSSPARADMLLDGSVSREPDGWRVRARLQDRTGFTLWSREFRAPPANGAALRDRVAVAVTDAAYIAMEPLGQRGLRLDPRTLALYISASKAFSNSDRSPDDDPRRLIEEVVKRAPDFAQGRAMLAANLANASRTAPPGEREAYRRRARQEAEKAIRLDPHSGAYDALHFLARLERPNDLVGAEDGLLRGIAAAPEFPYIQMRECRFLLEVGRAKDALRYCRRAAALRALSPPIDATYAYALYSVGDLGSARVVAARSARYHPDHVLTFLVRFETEAFSGDPARAMALLNDPGRVALTRSDLAGASPLSGAALKALDLALKAKISGAQGETDRALEALWRSSVAGQIDPRELVLWAAALGRPDDAFKAIDVFGPTQSPAGVGVAPGILLEPAAAPLRHDPRFWRAAAKAGYLQYWRARGVWPDFCGDPRQAIDCRKAAAQAGV